MVSMNLYNNISAFILFTIYLPTATYSFAPLIRSEASSPKSWAFSRSSFCLTRGDEALEDHAQFKMGKDKRPSMNRRHLFSFCAGIVNVSASIMATIMIPNPANAVTDPLFQPNPLTNKFLEQIRIMDQRAADDVIYGGELAPGKMRDTYAKLLVPVLSIEEGILRVNELIQRPDGVALAEASKLLAEPQYQKKEFKKVFNAFADNIYYSDPDRANAYLGGGATPKNEQSIAYMLRNEVLTNLEALQAEVAYLLKEKDKSGEDLDTGDLLQYGKNCADGMSQYLALVPAPELEIARSYLRERQVTSSAK